MKLPIYIIGFMGSGKSSFGRKLARQMSYEFIDLDDLIESHEGRSITQIFKESGESYFRKLESETLKKTNGKQAIISLGGGTACNNTNIAFIKSNGFSIYLKKNIKILSSRLLASKKKRPLIEGKKGEELNNFIQEKLKEREVYYSQADLIIDQINPNPKEISEKLSSM